MVSKEDRPHLEIPLLKHIRQFHFSMPVSLHPPKAGTNFPKLCMS